MQGTDSLWAWAARYLDDRRGVLVVARGAVRCGTPPAEARARADEAVHEAFLRVVNRYGPGHFLSFDHFRHTVTKTAINVLRDAARRRRWLPIAAEVAGGPGTCPRREAVRQALDRAAPEHRALLLAYFEEGITLAALADRVLPPDGRTVNARLLSARRRLRAALSALRAELLGAYPELDWPLPTD